MNDKGFSKGFTRREALKIGAGTVVGAAAFGKVGALAAEVTGANPSIHQSQNIQNANYLPEEAALKVDFAYAFAPPHRITAGRPDASDRTLLDVKPGSLKMSWTYDNLTMPNYPPLALRIPPTLWNIQITPEIDGKPFANSRWKRIDEVLPGLENIYENALGFVRMEGLS